MSGIIYELAEGEELGSNILQLEDNAFAVATRPTQSVVACGLGAGPVRLPALPARMSRDKRTQLGRGVLGCSCEGFRTPARTDGATHTGAGVRKPPVKEPAREAHPTVPRAMGIWGSWRVQRVPIGVEAGTD